MDAVGVPGGAGGREADTGGATGGVGVRRSPSSLADGVGVGVGVGSGAGVLRVADGAGGGAVTAAGDRAPASVCCAVHPAPSSTAAAAASAARPAGPRRVDSPQDIETPSDPPDLHRFSPPVYVPGSQTARTGDAGPPPGGSARVTRANPSAHHPARL
ncbi:hypothetical protein GCM10023079_08350 [Streptomyces chitinivorans]